MSQVRTGESRRSTRVPLKVVISAEGLNEPLTCDGETIVVNRHGARISCSAPLYVGLKIEIHVVITGKRAKAQIVYVDPEQPLVCGIALDKPEKHLGAVLSTGRLARRNPCIIESDSRVLCTTARRTLIDEKSPFHSPTFKKANGRRKLVKSLVRVSLVWVRILPGDTSRLDGSAGDHYRLRVLPPCMALVPKTSRTQDGDAAV
jgi:hypothetical protein